MLPLLSFYGVTWFSVIHISDRAIDDTARCNCNKIWERVKVQLTQYAIYIWREDAEYDELTYMPYAGYDVMLGLCQKKINPKALQNMDN